MKNMNSQPQDASPLGYQIALQRVGVDGAVRAFFDREFRCRLTEIGKAIYEEDGIRVREAGHALKRAGANLGLDDVRDAGISLEKAGKEYRLDDAAWILVRLRTETGRLKEFLQVHGYGEMESA